MQLYLFIVSTVYFVGLSNFPNFHHRTVSSDVPALVSCLKSDLLFCSYVSAMVPVKTMKDYDLLQEVTVLFSETVQRLSFSLLKFQYSPVLLAQVSFFYAAVVFIFKTLLK